MLRSYKVLVILTVLAIVHCFPLLHVDRYVAGGQGDPLTHAAIAGWFCPAFFSGDYDSSQFLSPYGVDLAGNYDSPFPFAIACSFIKQGSHATFHWFVFIQILLIIVCSYLVSCLITKNEWLQLAYVMAVWFCSFYIARSTVHFTLLSQIWGMQLLLFVFLTINLSSIKSVFVSSVLLGLAFAGTFHNIATLTIPLLVLFGFRLIEQRPFHLKGLAAVLVGLVVGASLVALFWWPMIEFTLNQGVPQSASSRVLYNMDLLGLLVPFSSHWLYEFVTSPSLDLERYGALNLFCILFLFVVWIRNRLTLKPEYLVLALLAILSLIFSLGSELRLNGHVFATLPFNEALANVFPFSVSRTPARFANIADMIFIFMAFRVVSFELNQWKGVRWLYPALLLLTIIFGPLSNSRLFVPTLDYSILLPQRGLEYIRQSEGNKVVLNIPTAWAQDPSQNFLQLKHQRPITSGYLSYPVYTAELFSKFRKTLLVGNLGCTGSAMSFERQLAINDQQKAIEVLRKLNIGSIIINKSLLGMESCGSLLQWSRRFLNNPWIRLIEENRNFAIYEIM